MFFLPNMNNAVVVQKRLNITNKTSVEDMDTYFTNLWKSNQKLHLIIDTTHSNNITLKRALTLKSIVDKHRCDSIRYIDHSTIIVKSKLIRTVVKTALFFLKTSRPVQVKCLSSTDD